MRPIHIFAAVLPLMLAHTARADFDSDFRVCRELKPVHDAVASCSRVLKSTDLSPVGRARILGQRGMAHSNVGAYGKAMTDFNRAIAMEPKLVLAYLGRGITYHKLGDCNEAIRDFSRVVEIGGFSRRILAGAYASRADCHVQQKRYRKALADYSQSLRIAPGHADRRLARGELNFKLGKFAAAVADNTKVLELNPPSAIALQAYLSRGAALLSLGEKARALRDFDQAAVLHPRSAAAHISRGDALEKMGRFHQAIAAYSRAIELAPKLALLYNKRGDAYRWSGAAKRAAADYGRAIKLAPRDPRHYLDRANAYLRLGRRKAAIADYSKAIAVDPKNYAAHHNRGSVYVSLKQFEKGRDDLSRAIALKPTAADSFATRGAAHEGLGRARRRHQGLPQSDRAEQTARRRAGRPSPPRR